MIAIFKTNIIRVQTPRCFLRTKPNLPWHPGSWDSSAELGTITIERFFFQAFKQHIHSPEMQGYRIIRVLSTG